MEVMLEGNGQREQKKFLGNCIQQKERRFLAGEKICGEGCTFGKQHDIISSVTQPGMTGFFSSFGCHQTNVGTHGSNGMAIWDG